MPTVLKSGPYGFSSMQEIGMSLCMLMWNAVAKLQNYGLTLSGFKTAGALKGSKLLKYISW